MMIQKLNRTEDNYYTDYEVRLKDQNYLGYAPYYIMDDVLSEKQVDDLNSFLSNAYDHRLFDGTVVGHDSEESRKCKIRDSRIHFVDQDDEDPVYKECEKILIEKLESINRNVFNLDITSYSSAQYTTYGVGKYFEWHPDGPFGVMDSRGLNCIPNHLQWRKLSMSLNLSSPNEYDGGDFQILCSSAKPDSCINTVRLEKGSIIVFPSFATHRVTEISSGTRKSLVYWFGGPRWR